MSREQPEPPIGEEEQPADWRFDINGRRYHLEAPEEEARETGEAEGHSHYFYSRRLRVWLPCRDPNCDYLKEWKETWRVWEETNSWPNPPKDEADVLAENIDRVRATEGWGAIDDAVEENLRQNGEWVEWN